MGRMLRASAVAAPLGMVVHDRSNGRWILSAGGTDIGISVGVPFAKVQKDVTPLGAAPVVAEGALYIPLSVVTDVLPRVAAGYLYDARKGELRRFRAQLEGPVVAKRQDTSVSTQAEVVRATPPRAPPAGSPRPAPRVARRRAPLVVVDAGHGGPDRGMSGPARGASRIYEADITLQIARKVRDELRARGIEVVMTRSSDTLIALSDRGKIANRHQASAFVSIHVNAANPRWRQPSGARGFETYFLAEAKTEDEKRVEEMENEVVKYDIDANPEEGDALGFVLSDMMQNEHLRESSELADAMQRGLGQVHPGPSRGVKQAGFRVLITAHMPAVLVEVGFGTNPADARYISGEEGQRALSRAIAGATITWLSQYERRTTSGERSR
jgi:N-acetylmuramoyl-L-alanine amidase